MKFGKIEGNDYNNLIMNDAITAFTVAVGDNISIQNMVDMFVDEYEDETGIDTGNSVNILYDSTDDYYSMGEGDITAIDNMEYANDGDAQSAYVTSTPIDNVLLVHFDGSDGATSTTDATGRHGTITFGGTAQLDDADKKWGTTSLLLDGNSDYITIPDSADWDIFASNSDDWTIEFWVQLEDTTSATFMEQFANSNNRWTLYYANAGSGIHLYVKIGGNNFINMYCDNWFTNTDWHHIAIIKVADEYAVYIDGSQENYAQTSTTGNVTAQLIIGKYGGGSSGYLNGHMDEIRIAHSNALNASPNVGKTDTIDIPTSAHTLISGTDIMAFSEDTVKEQGSYALKIEAEQTDSLNEILTKTVALDLSNRDTIKFKARATRIGTNFQVQIHDSGGTTSTYNVAIFSANTWETKEWDISGINSTDKDVVDELIIKIINADSANTIYIDEMYAYANATGFTLISENQTAESEPDEARIVILMEEINAITLNTDLKAWASKDDGITWAQITLEDVGDYGSGIKVLYGEVNLTQSGIGSGTDIVYKLTTHNSKNCKIHGTSEAWR